MLKISPRSRGRRAIAFFSVDKSHEDALKRYIKGQAEHHKTEDFKSELVRILRAHGVEFEEKYVFD
ncbi:MAG: hypothetical protein ABL907_19620 [Hyphomicrobium sp.]